MGGFGMPVAAGMAANEYFQEKLRK